MVKLCLLGLAGIFVACGVWYLAVIRPPHMVNLKEISDKREAEELKAERLAVQDPILLNKITGSDSVDGHLLDGSFTNVNRMKDLSEDCASGLYSSFLNMSGKTPSRSEIRIANVGQPAQFGDVLITDAPFRGLLLAGLGSKTCFIYYQHGGMNDPSYCLAVVDYAARKTIWVGDVRYKARSLQELRIFLYKHRIDDTRGEPC